MRFFSLLITFSSLAIGALGQDVTYYKDIEPIIQSNCVPCHRPNEAGPFSLTSYKEVASKGEFIAHVTKIRYMPPWRADVSFQQYLNQRILSDSAIGLIQDWVSNGMPAGRSPKAPTRKVQDPVREVADLVLRMPKPYKIQESSSDDYRFFNIPTRLPADRFIKKIEFVPGNKRLVHHSRLMTDTTHKVRAIDGMSANDPAVSSFEKYPPLDKFLYGWVPGNFPITFPKGTGKKLHKDTDLILNIHYSPTSKVDQVDQSTIKLYFAEGEVQREIFSLAIAEESITNGPFIINANEKKTFYSMFGPIPIDISAVAVLPHMHYLGVTFKAFAITPDGDAVPLIKIDDWDFKWQETYQFKNLLKIPSGSTIYMEATFDNTSANPSNPSHPPKDVGYGWNTTSEMMDLVLYYLVYQEGDEQLDAYADHQK